MNDQTSRFIDSARGMAALAVMLSHFGILAAMIPANSFGAQIAVISDVTWVLRGFALWRFSLWRGHAFLSEQSYSLYAMHLPVVVFLCAAVQSRFAPSSLSGTAAAMASILAATAVIVRLFWFAIEAKTPKLRALAHRMMEALSTARLARDKRYGSTTVS
jgi:peptidoglycan/LPS O-acetylase OafA/YrhL